MAQVQQMSAITHGLRPHTPPSNTRTRPLNPPRMSPSRIVNPLLTSPTLRSSQLLPDTFSPVNQNGSFEFDRVIKSGKVLRRTKKKGAWKPSWKPAYLVLRPNLLSVYNNEQETELKASITLSEVTAVARVKKTNTDNVFGIFTSSKNYHFSGFKEKETSNWVTLLRIEARTDADEELDLPAPVFSTGHTENAESETTDLSAEEDAERPGSPEAVQWGVRGNKSRSSTQTGQRKLSSLREYSANEQYTTSQSDFSDAAVAGLSSSIPRSRSLITSSFPGQSGKLTTIPSEGPLPTQHPESTSQISLSGVAQLTTVQTMPPDPNRVIRQGYLLMHKTVSGVRQWKTLWAVLRPTALALYKTTSEYKPLKIMPIHNVIDAAEIDPISKSKRHCFQVIGEEKTWKFNVDSERDLEGWLGALKSVLVKRSRGLSSAHGGAPSSAPAVTMTMPMNIPGSAGSGAVDRAKENAVPKQSPPSVSRGSTRIEPASLGNIVGRFDDMRVS